MTQRCKFPSAFISLSVAVTHALQLPVYRLFSQGPCGGNDRSGGTGLLAQVLEGNPPEVWEQEGRGRSRTPARWDLSKGMEATMHPTELLHPQTGYTQEPRAMPGLAPPRCLALLWQPGACRVEVGTTHMAPSPKGQASPAWKWSPRCLPSSPISGCPACQTPLGQGWGGRTPRGSQRDGRADGRGRAGGWREPQGLAGRL